MHPLVTTTAGSLLADNPKISTLSSSLFLSGDMGVTKQIFFLNRHFVGGCILENPKVNVIMLFVSHF